MLLERIGQYSWGLSETSGKNIHRYMEDSKHTSNSHSKPSASEEQTLQVQKEVTDIQGLPFYSPVGTVQ